MISLGLKLSLAKVTRYRLLIHKGLFNTDEWVLAIIID